MWFANVDAPGSSPGQAPQVRHDNPFRRADWREVYSREPYYESGRGFEDYGPAYELGWVSYSMYGSEFDAADRVTT